MKRPSSLMTSETLEKIFKESEISHSYFFPKEVPSLTFKEGILSEEDMSSEDFLESSSQAGSAFSEQDHEEEPKNKETNK